MEDLVRDKRFCYGSLVISGIALIIIIKNIILSFKEQAKWSQDNFNSTFGQVSKHTVALDNLRVNHTQSTIVYTVIGMFIVVIIWGIIVAIMRNRER